MIRLGLIGLAIASSLASSMSISAGESPVRYSADVKPILAGKCWACHGPDENTREADLRLDTPAGAAAVTAMVDGKAELVERILSKDPDLQMPPPSSKKVLRANEIDILRQWVAQGALFERHWAFLPPRRPALPDVKHVAAVRNPIDRFILSRLERAGLQLSPAADRTTLIRRVSLDLTGLPPTPEEVRSFLADSSVNAYEKLVDRLLASPRYGEHMAVEWLDASRYADTDGYQNDRYRYMHVWRDWVIMALNENKPYDEFLVEQLAGDMLPGATLKQQIATGFCRNHRINSEDGSIPAEWHVENVVDRVDTLGTAILGLTVGCARCHEHKYDPITQRDYYRLFAYFNNVPEWGVGPNNGNSPPFVRVPASWPNLSPVDNVAQVPEPVKLRRARKEAGNGLQRPQAGDEKTVMVMHEMAEPRPTYLLVRGQYDQPDTSEVLTPGVPEALNSFSSVQPRNRLELARWLTHPQHPLTSRVAVNRMWQHFFGTGIVKTSENLGTQGELPSHPALLDWLAVEFVARGWDVKAMHKMIVMSATYRQSSHVPARAAAVDPENRLLSHAPRIRLHAFALRDSMLASSGLLVEKLYGKPTKPYMPPKVWRSISNNTYKQDHGKGLYRRSIYTFWRRTIPPPTMATFNAAEREVCVVRKERTNTPLQALTLMNNIAFVEAARCLAERMLLEQETTASAIDYGFRLVTARTPSAAEHQLLEEAYTKFLQDFSADGQRAAQLLRVGEKPRNESLDPVQHAAMTMTASLIMNLDESITRE